MKFKLICVVLLCFLLITPSKVEAHPGRTDANGCHYCRTNCAKWGLSDGNIIATMEADITQVLLILTIQPVHMVQHHHQIIVNQHHQKVAIIL